MTVTGKIPESANGIDLRRDRDRFVAFAFTTADLLLEVDGSGKILYAAGAAKALTGLDAGALIGRQVIDLLMKDDIRRMNTALEQLKTRSRVNWMPIRLRGRDANGVSVQINGSRLPNGSDLIHLSVSATRPSGSATDVVRDTETGLMDASAFSTAASALIEAGDPAAKDAKLTLVRLQGLDEMRRQGGPTALSHLLSEIGGFLRSTSVNGDAAGQIEAGKYGVVHGGGIDEEGLVRHIEGLARNAGPCGQALSVRGNTVALDSANLSKQDAGRALAYTIKRFAETTTEGFNVATLADSFQEMLRDTVDKIGTLITTTAEARFELAFQPIVELSSRSVRHYELLARIEGGSPAEFFGFAEGIGMTEEFDLAVCQRAIDHLARLGPDSGVEVAVNLSGHSLQSGLFVAALLELLKSYRHVRRSLMFEITETMKITDLEAVNRVVQTLRQNGHRICLDDFGAGASSFEYLQNLTVDYVKIDGAYVERLPENSRDQTILRAMVMMCRDLGINTVAERVETDDQAKKLQELGVQFGQGYFFGRPGPAPEGHPPAGANGSSSPSKPPPPARRPSKGLSRGWAPV